MNGKWLIVSGLLVPWMMFTAHALETNAQDVVIGDFEAASYAPWTVTGEAFGSGPLGGNNTFWPYQGGRFAHSGAKGDQAVGTLTSPEFRIERRFVTFLIGGGNHPGETCVNLLVEGKVVRTATGADHEWMRRCLWDVAEFSGRTGRIEIVDKHKGNWGHINVDHIVLTDEERVSPWDMYESTNKAAYTGLPRYAGPDSSGWKVSGDLFGPEVGRLVSEPFKIDRRYLNFFCPPFGEMTVLLLRVEDLPVCASAYGPPSSDGWRCWDVSAFMGRSARFEVIDRHSVNIPQIKELAVFLSADKPSCSLLIEQFKEPARIAVKLPRLSLRYEPGSDEIFKEDLSSDYSEKYRPQFHFTVNHGHMNDPNGLLYYDGEYHLFMQHGGWGHAVSTDLVHWVQLEHALQADNLGACWSGSAVVDWDNTSGFQSGKEKVLVALFTSYKMLGVNPTESYSRQVQSLAYSNDRGRTWTKYPGNPVINEQDRDPRMFRHEPTASWRMVLMQGPLGRAYWASKDLKHWTKEGTSGFGTECPDLFEMPVAGEPGTKKWVAVSGNGKYMIGDFDGKTHKFESEKLRVEYGPNFYATQTFNDIPKQDGRRIQITWMENWPGTYHVEYPDIPFNGQQMTFPRELTLRRTAQGLRLFSMPVREIETLRRKEHSWKDLPLAPGQNPLENISGDLFDVRVELEPAGAAEVGLVVRGEAIRYVVKDQKLICRQYEAPVALRDHRLSLQVLVDRISLETFAQNGQATLSAMFMPKDESKSLELFATGGTAKVVSLQVYELASVWQRNAPR